MLGLLAGGARDTARGVVANLLDDVAAYAFPLGLRSDRLPSSVNTRRHPVGSRCKKNGVSV